MISNNHKTISTYSLVRILNQNHKVLLFTLWFVRFKSKVEREFSVGVDKLYKIGELAKKAGVNKSVIDHYTRLGLITPEKRTSGKYRLYSNETLEKLKFIKKCKERRLSLEEIKEKVETSRTVERAEIKLCITNAAISLDFAVNELKNLDKKIKSIKSMDTEAVRANFSEIETKIATMTDLFADLLTKLT